jgi:hypothetical protein
MQANQARLKQGQNTISIKVTNGANPGDCLASDQYQCNPAGVVFGASFDDALPMLPQCTGTDGKMYDSNGAYEDVCPAGYKGRGHYCYCDSSVAKWTPITGTCTARCTDPNMPGVTWDDKATETLACPEGQTGSQTRICMMGTWGS